MKLFRKKAMVTESSKGIGLAFAVARPGEKTGVGVNGQYAESKEG